VFCSAVAGLSGVVESFSEAMLRITAHLEAREHTPDRGSRECTLPPPDALVAFEA
jgi:hypothetical protein